MAKKKKEITFRTFVEYPDGHVVPWEELSKKEQQGVIDRAMVRLGNLMGVQMYKNGVPMDMEYSHYF